ncbi:DUF5677 domain-containing protein [Nocardioides sp. LHG3406-4]|uniref:DUF5677 domain-containing protein n=1 Tax=Nocardioides sp. LHG3406-4 TaxID=2804575 RepID=UPI003CEACE75
MPAPKYTEILAELDPDFAQAAETARVLQALVVQRLISGPEYHRAVRLIATLAISDVFDLIDEVERGSGRAAMRSARSLIEHAVNIHSVITSEEAAERYLAHLDQGPILLADAPEAPMLDTGPRRTVIRAARRAANAARSKWEESLERYGASFARQWHTANLYDRAAASGRGDLYDLYRVGSAVAHGSSAGAIGQFRLHDSDVATYAAGRVPALVPLALATGVEAYLQLLVHLEDKYPGFDANSPGSAVKHLVTLHGNAVWKAAQTATRGITDKAEVVAYLAFSARGKTRWYIHSSEMPSAWLPASPDPYAKEVAEWLLPVREAYVEGGGEFTEGGWAAMEVGPISLWPDWSKRSIPTGTMPLIVMTPDMDWITGEVVEEGAMINGWTVHRSRGDPPSDN